LKSSEKPLETTEPAAVTPGIPLKAYEFLLELDAQFKEAFRQELLTRTVDSCDYAEAAAQCFVNLMRTNYRIDMRRLCANEELRSREPLEDRLDGPLPSPTLLKRLQEYLVNPIP
jgi:hypothetical protein